MSRLKQLFSETIIYGVSSVFTRFINLLLLPLYTSILSPGEYGVLNILNSTFSILWLVSVLALDSASFVFFHDFEEKGKRKRIFASWFWAQSFMGLVLCLIVFFSASRLSGLFFGQPGYSAEIRMISLLLLFNLFPNIIWNWLRANRKVKTTAMFTVFQSAIIIGCNVWFILDLKLGIKGFFYAQLVSGLVMSLTACIMLKDWVSLKFFDRTLLKRMLVFSLPLVPTAIASWGLNSTGGYFIQANLGSTEVGLYQTGLTLSGILAFVTTSFTQAWGPFAMSIKSQEDAPDVYAKVFIIYITFLGVIAAFMLSFSSEILKLLTTKEYYGADWVFGLSAFNVLLIGLNYVAGLGLNIVKNMKPFAVVSIIGSIINLVMFYFGAKYFGKEGCAVASLITNSGIVFFTFRESQMRVKFPYNFLKGTVLFGACLIFSVLLKFVSENLQTAVLVKFLGLLTLGLFVLYVNWSDFKGFAIKIGFCNLKKV